MQSVKVTLSETYDLSTRVGKIGCVGVHTPGKQLIKAQWNGLWQNFRRVHLDSCRVVLACASQLPADPLQIGTSAGTIAPQDMFNPILYKPVSNDSFSIVQNRIKTISAGTPFPAGSIDNSNQLFGSLNSTIQDRIYYNLLSDKSWRKAMPQQGFIANGLYPIVYEVVNSYGGGSAVIDSEGTPVQSGYDTSNLNLDVSINANAGSSGNYLGTNQRAPFTMRGASKRMPSVPIHNGANDGNASEIPCTYVLMLITPPAKLYPMYFRLKVEWTISFHGLIPFSEYDSTTLQASNYVYGSDYSFQSKDAEDKLGLADSFDAEMEQVM